MKTALLSRMGFNASGALCGLCPPLSPAGAAKGQFGLAGAPFGYPGHGAVPGHQSVVGLGRLVALCAVATLGTLGNLYTVSACIVGDRLRKKGNVFLVNLSMTMLLVTLVVMPSLAVHVLADADISPQVRRIHDHLVELCGCVSLFTLLCVAVETYVRLCHRRLHGRLVTRRCVVAGLVLVWSLGGATFASALLARSGPHAETQARLLIGTGGTVTLLTSTLYLLSWRRARHLRRCSCHGRRARPLAWHVQLARANAAVWLGFCMCWLPVAALRTVGPALGVESRQEWLQWLPLAHATAFNLLYGVFSEDFRESYGNLARYCCCRMSVEYGRRPPSDVPRPLQQRGSSQRGQMTEARDEGTQGDSETPGRGQRAPLSPAGHDRHLADRWAAMTVYYDSSLMDGQSVMV